MVVLRDTQTITGQEPGRQEMRSPLPPCDPEAKSLGADWEELASILLRAAGRVWLESSVTRASWPREAASVRQGAQWSERTGHAELETSTGGTLRKGLMLTLGSGARLWAPLPWLRFLPFVGFSRTPLGLGSPKGLSVWPPWYSMAPQWWSAPGSLVFLKLMVMWILM